MNLAEYYYQSCKQLFFVSWKCTLANAKSKLLKINSVSHLIEQEAFSLTVIQD